MTERGQQIISVLRTILKAVEGMSGSGMTKARVDDGVGVGVRDNDRDLVLVEDGE